MSSKEPEENAVLAADERLDAEERRAEGEVKILRKVMYDNIIIVS